MLQEKTKTMKESETVTLRPKEHKQHQPIEVCLIGDGMVGKTKLVQAFTGQEIEDETKKLLNTYTGKLKLPTRDVLDLCIHDPAGQEEYEKLRSPLYKECDVIIVCYSEMDRCSYENVTEFWIPEMTKCTSHRPPLVLAGTFYDVNGNGSSTETVISKEEGTLLMKEIDADIFVRCHIQDPKDVTKVFLEAAISALTKKKRRDSFLQRIWGRSKSFSTAITTN